jgi:uncharacterized protein (TIGR00369 family)
MTAERSRTHEWADPMITASKVATMSGMELLNAVVAGELPPPPIATLMGFGLATVEDGRAVFTMEPAEYQYNPIGSVHGGVFATMLDSAAGCAVHSKLPAGVGYTSLDLIVKYLRPMTIDTGPVQCIGTVTHLGSRTALAEARIIDGKDRLLATAVSSCLILRP